MKPASPPSSLLVGRPTAPPASHRKSKFAPSVLAQCGYEDEEHRVFTPGVVLQRIMYHYWYHLGENMAIRHMLGHSDPSEFVGEIEAEAPYLPHL